MIQNPNTRNFPSSGKSPQSLSVTSLARRITSAKKKYIKWLNRNHPEVLKNALEKAGLSRKDVGLSGMGAANPAGPGQTTSTDSGEEKAWYDKILDYVPTAIQTYSAYEQQKQLIELNEKRARQGLEPLNTPPAIRVEGEAGPETRRAMQESVQNVASQYLPYIAGGIGLFLLMNMNSKKR